MVDFKVRSDQGEENYSGIGGFRYYSCTDKLRNAKLVVVLEIGAVEKKK